MITNIVALGLQAEKRMKARHYEDFAIMRIISRNFPNAIKGYNKLNLGINAKTGYPNVNRGRLLEMCFTNGKGVKDSFTKEGVSRGDFAINGVKYEHKFLTTQTKADPQANGTTCDYYLITFLVTENSPYKDYFGCCGLITKKIAKKDLIIEKGKITFQNNYDKGVIFAHYE